MKRFEKTLRESSGLYSRMVKGCEPLERGLVECRHCGAKLKVNSAACLRSGWPECCGETMLLVTRPRAGEGEP